jgi:hypothetical protein
MNEAFKLSIVPNLHPFPCTKNETQLHSRQGLESYSNRQTNNNLSHFTEKLYCTLSHYYMRYFPFFSNPKNHLFVQFLHSLIHRWSIHFHLPCAQLTVSLLYFVTSAHLCGLSKKKQNPNPTISPNFREILLRDWSFYTLYTVNRPNVVALRFFRIMWRLIGNKLAFIYICNACYLEKCISRSWYKMDSIFSCRYVSY